MRTSAAVVVFALLVAIAAADWKQVHPSGYQPDARKFHSAVVQGSDVLYFAGTNGASSFNDVFAWNFENNTITNLTPSGPLPKERHLHTAVLYNGDMVVFAGHLYAGVAFANDMWVWSTSDNSWSRVTYANNPPPVRAAHAAAVVGNQMWVYGGTGPNATNSDAPNITYDDLWAFDFTTLMWQQYSTSISIGPRTGVVFGAIGNELYLYGGQDGNSNAFDGLLSLDTSQLNWTVYSTISDPGPNSFYQAVVHGDRYYTFGGTNTVQSNAELWEFEQSSSTWQQIGASSSVQPQPVSGSAGGIVGNVFSVFGGANLPGGSVIADFYVYGSL